MASGAVAGGAVASGAVASGAVASGAVASGAVASGAVWGCTRLPVPCTTTPGTHHVPPPGPVYPHDHTAVPRARQWFTRLLSVLRPLGFGTVRTPLLGPLFGTLRNHYLRHCVLLQWCHINGGFVSNLVVFMVPISGFS